MRGALRDPKKEAFWRRMLREQGGSGLSVRAWCDRCGLNQGTFCWWRRELARRDAAGRDPGRAEDAKPAFMPVRVAAAGETGNGGSIEIVLTGGHRIRLSGCVDRQMLAEVLAVMEGQVC